MRKYRFLSLLFPFTLIYAACSGGSFYESTHTFTDVNWSYEDTIKFAFNIQDTSLRYNMYLDIEHKSTYPFQNLYVKIHSAFPDGQLISEQHSLELQGKNGTWISVCRGQDCGIRFILRENMRFDQLGAYTVFLEQFTRTENLKGVESLGLVLKIKQ
jgi:gliding motility-associated lipoprotein GldH